MGNQAGIIIRNVKNELFHSAKRLILNKVKGIECLHFTEQLHRKKNNFDDIPLPDSMNFEDVIQQGCDMASKTAIFTTSEDDNKVKKLMSLLDRLYNGKNIGKRNLMEERFWNLFVDDYVGFLGRLHAYIDNRNQDTYQLVVDDLYQDAPILGFKYNFIKHNTELFEIFKDEMKWNKPSHTH